MNSNEHERWENKAHIDELNKVDSKIGAEPLDVTCRMKGQWYTFKQNRVNSWYMIMIIDIIVSVFFFCSG